MDFKSTFRRLVKRFPRIMWRLRDAQDNWEGALDSAILSLREGRIYEWELQLVRKLVRKEFAHDPVVTLMRRNRGRLPDESALAAGTGTAETSETSARAEGCQSGGCKPQRPETPPC